MTAIRCVLAVLLAAIASTSSVLAAIDPDDLLPVEEAFALTATATERGRIEFQWTIADGYYLYKHRIAATAVDSSFKFNPLQLPTGEKKHDEFFGDVETYRDSLIAVLTGAAATGATEVTFNVRYQGCADVGVCYPPHQQRVTVLLPAESATEAAETSGNFAAPPSPQPSPASGRRGEAVDTEALPGAAATGVGSSSLLRALGGDPSAPLDGATEALPLPPEQAFGFEAIASSPTELLLRFTPAPGYYLYRDRSSFRSWAPHGHLLGTPRWPPGAKHKDEHFGEVIVYFDQIEVPLPLKFRGGNKMKLRLEATFQGCQTDGICYPPMTREVVVDLPKLSSMEIAAMQAASGAETEIEAETETEQTTEAVVALGEDGRLAAALAGPNRLLTLLSFFGFGLLLAFTPCVFPMIPILSGIIAGAGQISTARAFVLSLVYVLATAVIFTLAGVVAGLAGANLQAAFQQPWILTAFALLFVALAFSMFGFYELQLPTSLQTRLTALSNRQSGGSLVGVAIMGVLSALIVGPCVAPPLAAAVLYIAQTRDPVLGGLALFALSLGMGAPLLVFGTAAGRIMPRAGAWMDAVKAVFGVLFLGLAIWMLERFLPPFWILLMVGALLIACGVYLGALERLADGASGWKRLWKSLGVVLLLLGAMELIGAFGGGRDALQPLRGVFGGGGERAEAEALPFQRVKSIAELDATIAAANANGKPVLFDFYADWCVACKEMEKYTFTAPAVHAALADFVLVKADVTANDEIDQALMQRFGIIGPPATLFFGLDGREQRDVRLIGFEAADEFVARTKRVAR